LWGSNLRNTVIDKQFNAGNVAAIVRSQNDGGFRDFIGAARFTGAE
jgi:hypothetical protein